MAEGPWKIVFRNQSEGLDKNRGQPRIRELYNLDEDIAETTNVAEQEPEILKHLDTKLRDLVARGTSRDGPTQANDTEVVIDVTQSVRWGAPVKKGEG